jgi:photosystem II stability/assembly factor-like uncharacterized protein
MRIQDRTILSVTFALFAAFTPKGLLADVGRWTSSGPHGGAVLALAVVPSEPSTVYLATERRLYKSVDSGAHWASAGLGGSFDIVVTTSTPSVVYAATVSGQPWIHRTTDGGETWVQRLGPVGRLRSASVDPNDPMVVYVATDLGLFRTADGGESWRELGRLPSGARAAGITVDPAESAVVYAGVTAEPIGLYRSSDTGATWTRTNLREPTRTLVFDPLDESRVFALTNTGLRVSTNHGQSWRRLASTIQLPSYVVIDPADPSRLYVVDRGSLYYSSDGGETVTPAPVGNVSEPVRAIAVSGSSVALAGSARGVYRSEDAGLVWRTSNLGIGEIDVRSVAIDPTNPAIVFAASSLGIHQSGDGGKSWIGPFPGSPVSNVVAIDPTDRSTIYAAGNGVHKSTNGGETWENRSPRDAADSIAALLIDPSNPRRIFASSDKVFRSVDGTQNWEIVMRPEDDVEYSYYPPRVSALSIAPSGSATVYAGGAINDYYNGFVSRSEDGGTGWPGRAVLTSPVTALAADPCDPRIVYAGTYSGIYRSTDGGASWSEPGLPGFSISSLVLDPRHSSSAFAGTASGLFWTNDSGATWTLFEPFLTVPILSLAIDASGRFLHAATRGAVFDLERTFEACRTGPDRLCLIGAKYQVSMTARDPRTGAAITGRAIAEGDRFGYFSLPDVTGDPDLPEVLVKMVNASGQPAPYGGHDWVFHSALTDFDYTLTVLETETGRVRTYFAADAASLTCGTADTSAFVRSCLSNDSSAAVPGTRLAAGSGTELSFLRGRFRATIRAEDPRTGRIAEGAAIPRADGFGYFSLPAFTGDPRFPEVFVKMVDATALPGGYFWVFHTGLTDTDYTLTVTDQVTGRVKTYRRAATDGARLCGSADTTAFRN